MQVTRYVDGQAEVVPPEQLADTLAAGSGVLWVDMVGPSEADVQAMRDVFGFHPMAVEDTLNDYQRPKVEQYPEHLFIILNSVDRTNDGVQFHEVDVFVAPGFVVTVHGEGEHAVGQAQGRVPQLSGRLAISAGYLLYVLIDTVVDGYFPMLDQISEAIDQLEDDVLSTADRESLNRMFNLKRLLQRVARAAWPQREIVTQLLHPDLLLDSDETLRYYLRDVQDHLLWVADTVNAYRDTLTSITDLYMSAVSNRLNVVVNRLAVITVLIGVMTVVSGFYGMNFRSTWPPFGEPWGVPVVMGIMALLAAGLIWLFRRLRWV